MNEKNKSVRNVSALGIIFNIILLVIKIIIGVISKSQAMIADGINSAGDIFASLMSYIGNKISSIPKDENHPYGHGKAEYIFSFVISTIMISVSLIMFKNSVFSIINKNMLEFSYNLVFVCLITICIKMFLYIYATNAYKKNKSILIKANMEDHRNDMIITLGTLIGIICSYNGLYFVDGIVGALISIWIACVGIKLAKSSYEILMDTDLPNEQKQSIIKISESFEEVIHVDSVRAKPTGDKYMIILKISMDGNLTLNKSHKISGIIKERLLNELDYLCDVVIHVNPH